MDEFVSAVSDMRDRLLASVDSEGHAVALAYLHDEDRLSEANFVAPCVSRFVSAEITPPPGVKPIGRFSGVTGAATVAAYIRRSGKSHEEAVTSNVRSLVMRVVARGYVAMAEAEALIREAEGPKIYVVSDRMAEDVWPYWVTNMSTGTLLRSAAHPKAVDTVARAAGEQLLRGLEELNLVGWRRGRVVRTGSLYGESGMLLRMLQTDNFQPGARSDLLTVTNAWPFDEMPTG